ncbi:hypothetical protein GF358_00520 [Candidatus Woesearchaeota archaeon]|nr:hypothetical protein [Candidatus Woesearchaeota archaeon]
MQLTIDTQKDSHAEIRKAVRMLMSMIGDKEVYTNEVPKAQGIFGEDKPPATDAFANMFGSNDANKDEYSELNVPDEEKKEDKPQKIELY